MLVPVVAPAWASSASVLAAVASLRGTLGCVALRVTCNAHGVTPSLGDALASHTGEYKS